MRAGHKLSGDPDWLIDQDFDDDAWRSYACIVHEIEEHGAVALHPDGDRREFDPVPLHGGGHSTWMRPEYSEWIWLTPPMPAQLPRSEPDLIRESLQGDSVDEAVLLQGMKIDEPVERGCGRVWYNLVMMNEADINADIKQRFEEIWHGRGLVILRKLL